MITMITNDDDNKNEEKRTGCRSVGDYHHKAWVGATLNIHSISNVHYEADDDEDDVDDDHADYDEVGHEKGKGGTLDLNGEKNPSWLLLLFDFRFRLKIGGGDLYNSFENNFDPCSRFLGGNLLPGLSFRFHFAF